MFKKYVVCQVKFAKQIIAVSYLCNEVRADSSSWSSVTYVSHLFTACINLFQVW